MPLLDISRPTSGRRAYRLKTADLEKENEDFLKCDVYQNLRKLISETTYNQIVAIFFQPRYHKVINRRMHNFQLVGNDLSIIDLSGRRIINKFILSHVLASFFSLGSPK